MKLPSNTESIFNLNDVMKMGWLVSMFLSKCLSIIYIVS